MCVHVELQQIDEVPPDSRVAHFDELDSLVQDRFFELVDHEAVTASEHAVTEFERHDVIKFTDYYEVSLDG